MTVSFEGIGENVVTFYNAAAAASKAAQGDPVRLSAAATVAKCADGERFCGVAVSADEDFAGVQTSGFVTVPYTGAAPSVGYAYLLANGTGGVKADSAATKTGGEFLVVAVDTAAATVSFVM